MSRVRDMPEIEEVSGPSVKVLEPSNYDDDRPRSRGPPKVTINEPTPTTSGTAITLTPKTSDSTDRPNFPSQEDQNELKRRKARKKEDSEIVLGILNMMMAKVDQNANNINKYVLKRFEENERDDGITRKDKVPVDVRVIFMKVIDVDTLKQEFKAELFVQARWLEPKLKNLTDSELEKFQGENIWTPKVIVTNMVGDPDDDDTWYVAARYPDFKYPAVTMRRKIIGNFSEILELNDFPLDVQELTVQISSRRSEKEVILQQDSYRMSTVNVHGFLDQDQFELYPHVICSTGHVSSELTSMKDRHSAIFFSCSVKRKSGYFFWNIFLMMFIISSLAFTAFSIPATNPQNRLAVSLTLLLTAIAFKFIINKSIPQIPYLTYLDIYVLGCMILLATHAVEHALITAWKGNDTTIVTATQAQVDLYMLIFIATCHVSFNIAFGIFLIIMNRRANTEVTDRDKEYSIQRQLTDAKRKKMKKQVDEDMYTPIA